MSQTIVPYKITEIIIPTELLYNGKVSFNAPNPENWEVIIEENMDGLTTTLTARNLI